MDGTIRIEHFESKQRRDLIPGLARMDLVQIMIAIVMQTKAGAMMLLMIWYCCTMMLILASLVASTRVPPVRIVKMIASLVWML